MNKHVIVASTPQDNREAFTAAYAHAQALIANGRQVRITVEPFSEDVSTRQRRFYHGPVLTQIADQVRVCGARYTAGVWKEHLRELFLPDAWKDGKPVRVSSEDLGVAGYSNFIDKVIAHAVTEWGVAFQFNEREREAVRHRETADEA